MGNYIPDGQNFEATIEPGEDHHEPLKIRYRPVSWAESEILSQKVAALPVEKSTTAILEFLLKQLVSWELKNDETGEPVEISLENFGKIRRSLPVKIYNAIMDTRGNEVEESAKNSRGD